jgi:hypothetical protein
MVMLNGTQELDTEVRRLSKFSGGCRCGRIKVQLIAREGSGSIPRVCKCDFCTKHAAIMLCIPDGLMILEIPDQVDTQRKGSGITEFHVCPDCDVFVAATRPDRDKLLGAVNLRIVERSQFLGRPTPIEFDHETVSNWQAGNRLTWMPVLIASQHIAKPVYEIQSTEVEAGWPGILSNDDVGSTG